MLVCVQVYSGRYAGVCLVSAWMCVEYVEIVRCVRMGVCVVVFGELMGVSGECRVRLLCRVCARGVYRERVGWASSAPGSRGSAPSG